VLDIGGKEKNNMTKRVEYTDAPQSVARSLERARKVADFLPSPDKLVLKEKKEKITIAIDKDSLNDFKRYAKAHDTKYQVMINSVLQSYAHRFLK
jgi:uncharacterized protein (DUF4415 family)